MARPCEHTAPKPGCNCCWLRANRPSIYRLRYGGAVRAGGDPEHSSGDPWKGRPLPCAHLGPVEEYAPGAGPRHHRRACALHGDCTLARCPECPGYEPSGPAVAPERENGDPQVGLVVASHDWPELVELQIRLARRRLGAVPVLIADDASPGTRARSDPRTPFGRLRALAAREPGVTLWPNPQRLGHAGGDISAVWKGVLWAQALGLEFVGKVSRRLLVDRLYWLQDAARLLLERGACLASRPCTQARPRATFPFRSECAVYDVRWWARPEVLDRLLPVELNPPGQPPQDAERHLWAAVEDFGGSLAELPWLPGERLERAPGLLWHNANPEAEYRELAALYGLDLGPSFSTRPSQEIAGYKLG